MENFVITIARGFGSGGKTIAQQLAQKLDVNFYDRKLLRIASDQSGINEALFGQLDEKLKGNALLRISKKFYSGEVFPPDDEDFLSDENLYNYQAKVIKELAAEESCVILGRCANYVLKDYKNVLRVYIHAPIEACIKSVSSYTPLPDAKIEKMITTTDKKRAAYYRYFTGHDWRNAQYYDLCLNSDDIGRERCVELITDYLQIKVGNKKPSGQ